MTYSASWVPFPHAYGVMSLGPEAADVGGYGVGDAASTTWPTANLAMLVPFSLAYRVTVHRMWMFNGSSVAGNIDIGVYDTSGTRLGSTGSTAQSGTSVPQNVNSTDFDIGPGVFYMALACSSTSANIFAASASTGGEPILASMGLVKVASSFPLPSSLTFEAWGTTGFRVPLFGLSFKDVQQGAN